MSNVYKLQYNGMTLAYPGWNGFLQYENMASFKTLTLYASEGGTVTASVLTGRPGDTAQIMTAYDTYYRFSGYDTAGGGSLNGDVYTFGDSDADISAVYKVNSFFVSGRFTHITAATATANRSVTSDFYAYKTYNSGNASIPDSFYVSKTSYQNGNKIGNKTSTTTNTWSPTGDISGYVWSGYCDTNAFQRFAVSTNYLTARGHSLVVNSTNFGSTAGSVNGTTKGATKYGNTGTTNTIGYVHCTAKISTPNSYDYWLTNQSYTTANSLWWASGILP